WRAGGGFSRGRWVEPDLLVPQFVGQNAQRQARVQSGAGGHNGKRERQPGAVANQLINDVRLGRDALLSQAATQQGDGLLGTQDVQGDWVGTFLYYQAGQLVAAGDHDPASGAARQQGADLVGVPGVVQHHQ